ncbi:hypothetical protein MAP00_002844 [Monascus purpureus]|nr:hypothetical protein MAP00_002844 [Monascus purpureus]
MYRLSNPANSILPSAMPSDPNSPRSKALRLISNSRFHRTFTLPATPDHDELTITYADAGHDPEHPDDRDSTTILFMPGMFSSRYHGIPVHVVAEKLDVRVLVIDRPGMGNSTNTPLDQRVPVWLEIVPHLLAHLGIEHVALISHSAGTIYLLNTLYHCRGILHPERPYVALLCPWVDPAHSHVTTMQLAQHLPSKAFNVWNQIPRFFLLKASPKLACSGAVMTKIHDTVTGGDIASKSQLEKNRQRMEEGYGVPRAVQVEVDNFVTQFLFKEDTEGANSEALQCLRKGREGMWGECEDYGVFVREFVEQERRAIDASDAGRERGEKTLKVRLYFAERDAMIGKKGQEYVEECWKVEDGEFQDVLDVRSCTVSGVEHDSLPMSVEVWEKIFLEARGDDIQETPVRA